MGSLCSLYSGEGGPQTAHGARPQVRSTLFENFHRVDQQVITHKRHVVTDHRQLLVLRCHRLAFIRGEAWGKDVMNTGPPKTLHRPDLTHYLACVTAGQRRSPTQSYDSRMML
jgi:hypothetical protein